MPDLEHTVIGVVFAVCAAIMYLGAVPYYTLRHVGPGKPPPMPSGNVSIAGFGIVDAVGVSMFFGWYALNWAVAIRQGVDLSEAENLPVLLAAQLGLQFFMVAAVILLLCWRTNLVTAAGIRFRRWPWLLIIAPLTVFIMWSFMAILESAGYNKWISELVGGDAQQEAVKMISENGDALSLAMMAVVACVGAPLAEEVVFRGYIYTALKRFSNIPVAILFSGLLFGAVHMNLAALLPLTVLGIVLALLYEGTGSIWAPIAVHFTFNLATVTLQFLMRVNPEFFEELEKNAAFIGLG